MNSTKKTIVTGMFAAVIAVLAQISFPLPSGVPVTLQTFAVALTGVVLGRKLGTMATFIYILLGTVGVPVFAGFKGGLGVIAGKTGGFIWGFLFLALLCGIGSSMTRKAAGCLPGLLGLAICHFLGTVQFSVLTGMGLGESAWMVSIPYLIKDICSVALAYVLGLQVRKQLYRAAFLEAPAAKKEARKI